MLVNSTLLHLGVTRCRSRCSGAKSGYRRPHGYELVDLDIGDVFTDPLNGATVTITGITAGTGSTATSIAYTKTGTFASSPATLAVFQGWLTAGTLVRGSYRGVLPPARSGRFRKWIKPASPAARPVHFFNSGQWPVASGQ